MGCSSQREVCGLPEAGHVVLEVGGKGPDKVGDICAPQHNGGPGTRTFAASRRYT